MSAERDGAIQDGMQVAVTVTNVYTGRVTDYERGEFIYLDGRRVSLAGHAHTSVVELGDES